MNVISLDKDQLRTPSSWSELRPSMALRVAGILLGDDVRELRMKARKDEKELDYLGAMMLNADWFHVRLQLLFAIVDLRWRWRLQWKMWRLKPEHYAQMLRHESKIVDWLFLRPLTVQLLPSIPVGGDRLYGPRDYMGGVSILEFEMAQERYSLWRRTRKREHLQMFFAVIYRPLRNDIGPDKVEWHRDRRAELNEITSDKESGRLKTVDENAMLLAVLYWEGCLKRMRKDYSHVFQGEGSKRQHSAGHLIVKLAATVKKMDVDETSKADLHVVMYKLNSDLKEQEERVRAAKRRRK